MLFCFFFFNVIYASKIVFHLKLQQASSSYISCTFLTWLSNNTYIYVCNFKHNKQLCNPMLFVNYLFSIICHLFYSYANCILWCCMDWMHLYASHNYAKNILCYYWVGKRGVYNNLGGLWYTNKKCAMG